MMIMSNVRILRLYVGWFELALKPNPEKRARRKRGEKVKQEKESPGGETQEMTDKDFQRLMLLAERNFCSALNIVLSRELYHREKRKESQLRG